MTINLAQQAAACTAVEWVSAIGTWAAVVLALVIAIWHDRIRLPTRCRLRVSIANKEPDCIKVTVHRYDTEQKAESVRSRLRVEALHSPARNVQLFATGLEQRLEDDSFAPVPSFLPSYLLWADFEDQVEQPTLYPDSPRWCGLAHVLDPKARHNFNLETTERCNNPSMTTLSFDVALKTSKCQHIVAPGRYRLTIQATAANAPPQKVEVNVVLTGKWFDDLDEMLREGLRVVVK